MTQPNSDADVVRWIAELEAACAEMRTPADSKRPDDALEDSALQLRAFLERSPMAIAVVAMDGTIDYINRRVVETFGYRHEDIPVLDRWWEQAYPDPAYRAEVSAVWAGLVRTAMTRDTDIERRAYRVTCKDGSVKTVDISGCSSPAGSW